jgi:multiple sugar transport system permease protein
MGEKKIAEINTLQAELDELIAKVCKGIDDSKEKKKCLSRIEKLRRTLSKKRSGSKLSRDFKRDLVSYSFIAPNFIGFAVFTLVPIVFAFALAFLKWDGSNAIQFMGLNNFKRLGSDVFFKAAFKNTIIYCVGTVPLTMIASLALAIILNQKVRGRAIFRTLSFFPYVGSLVAVTAVWKMLFHPSKGPINSILYHVFNVPMDKLPQWFSGGLVLLSLILFSVWKYMGYYMVIYLAGLQGTNPELEEAAELDGASKWQIFWNVTLPQLKPTTFFVIIRRVRLTVRTHGRNSST